MTERLRRMDWAHDRGAQIVVVLLVAVVLAAIPTNERQYANLIRITFLVLWYAIMAGAWNIIGGYAGQVSFGHAAFLGTGAYVDVVSYLLQANRFPSGARELPRTPEQLESIAIERK